MSREAQVVEERYDALMFAKTPEKAREAAVELVRAVLGDEAAGLSLQEALRRCCRRLRPAEDPIDQPRFEAEFIELAIWPGRSHRAAA